jgi:pyruvate ferredoxin oxidoreductase gamma subunit
MLRERRKNDVNNGGIMFQVRIHGRGGQGVVTAAEMLSIAAFEEGRHAQAFPSFGSERTGAPVVAFCRIADKEIRLREPIMEPDALIIQDPTLLLSGRRLFRPEERRLHPDQHQPHLRRAGTRRLCPRLAERALCTVPATDLSRKHVGRPMPNVPLLAGFAAASGNHPAGVGDQAINDQVLRRRWPATISPPPPRLISSSSTRSPASSGGAAHA